jgi:hypothetical protein
VHVIARSATSLNEAQRLGPEDTNASWDDVATLGDDRLAVIERCCNLPDENPERWRVIEVNASTGAVGGEVFGRDRTEAVLVDDRRDAQGMVVVQRGGTGGPQARWWGPSCVHRSSVSRLPPSRHGCGDVGEQHLDVVPDVARCPPGVHPRLAEDLLLVVDPAVEVQLAHLGHVPGGDEQPPEVE